MEQAEQPNPYNTADLVASLAASQVRAKPGVIRQREVQLMKEIKANQPGRPSKEAMIADVRKRMGVTRAKAKEIIKKFDKHMLVQTIAQLQHAELQSRASSALPNSSLTTAMLNPPVPS